MGSDVKPCAHEPLAWRAAAARDTWQTARSRLGRRMLLLFVVCALAPLCAFGVFAYREVSTQLIRQAREELRQETKALGMGIAGRLLQAEQELLLVERGGEPRNLRAVQELPLAGGGDLGPLGPAERAHLERGLPLLRTLPDQRSPRVVLARLRGDASPRLLAAEVDPLFLWALDTLDGRARFRVSDAAGALLVAAGEPAPAAVAADWTLTLEPHFRSGAWSVALSVPEAVVFAPLGRFRMVFPLVAASALCLVLLLGLGQIRYQLRPVRELHRATRRIAAGELDTRVEVAARDELGDLAESFNAMASSMARSIDLLVTLNEVGSALSSQSDSQVLVDTVVRGAMAATAAEEAGYYARDPRGRLHPVVLRSLNRPGEAESDGAAVRRREIRRRALIQRAADRCQTLHEEPADGRPAVLTLPLRDHEGEVLGVLQLASPTRFRETSVQIAESLASQAAVAFTKNRLIDSFKNLFEGLIGLTVEAIDEKSPHTGGHCRRVPILCEMITDAACESDRGPLAGFELNPEERYELRIAALLHDCGKVTTPVHVMDKSTKLETILDRIALVDTRFEVLRRDALLRGAQPDELVALEEERAFLHRVNVGTEEMDPADQQRVREIAAKYRWRGPDGAEHPVLSDDEVENLTIPRGTLTEAEREVINFHVVSTIRMLEKLPFPRNMRNVPAIAGAHHERVDGRGYPKQLTRDQISMQGRILGLADVFEALTAQDRPYKPGRTLSESLRILEKMSGEGHIDPDLYELFVRDRIYLRYAADYLPPEQIDESHLPDLARLELRDAERAAEAARAEESSRPGRRD